MWHDDIGGNIDIGGGLLVLMALERRLNKAKGNDRYCAENGHFGL
jgi:hypothetical protein